MAVLASPEYTTEESTEPEPMVPIGPYKGVLGTLWSITREEGTSVKETDPVPGGAKVLKKNKKAARKGQGVQGLWRGWRVGVWGLVGVWSARAMSGGGSGGEF